VPLLHSESDAGGQASNVFRMAAAGGGHLEVVERPLAENADVNAATTNGHDRTVLQAAAEKGHLKVVERLLAANADVNAAAAEDYSRTALAENADVDAIGGRTALQAAAEGGHLAVVERLLAANANVNAAGLNMTVGRHYRRLPRGSSRGRGEAARSPRTLTSMLLLQRWRLDGIASGCRTRSSQS
jgi:ankyrin repeat protein